MWNVVLLEEVDAWFLDLVRTEDPVAEHVAAAIELLARTGPSLGRPAVDSIKGSTVHNLKELRASTVRVLFAFDPARRAVLLVAGDKAGRWDEWYRATIPVAEHRYEQWLIGEYDEEV
ncbi:type II toxin-antitoxin system RelE/ParE family toxin [Promicromonospora sp. NPDC060204]|uniref:type II toxin-antitoxin system RelE/ParE family toxin n=1 Tax=Promicromonospora sp. NPDC060204 TaxID=3347071 RepID=UPI00364B195F